MSNEISIDMLNQTSDNEISNNETSTIETHFGVNYHQGINTNENSRENSTSRRNVNPRLENTLPLCVTDPKNRIPRRYNIIKTSCMMKDDCPRHRTYLKLMLLRINSGNDIGKEEIFFILIENKVKVQIIQVLMEDYLCSLIFMMKMLQFTT